MSIGEQSVVRATSKMRWHHGKNGFQAPILTTITLAPATVEDYVGAICAKWYSRKRGPRWTSAKSNLVKILLGTGISAETKMDVVVVAVKDLLGLERRNPEEGVQRFSLRDVYRRANFHGLTLFPLQAILELCLALDATAGLIYVATELVRSPHRLDHIFFLDSGRRGWSVGSKYFSYVEPIDWTGAHLVFRRILPGEEFN